MQYLEMEANGDELVPAMQAHLDAWCGKNKAACDAQRLTLRKDNASDAIEDKIAKKASDKQKAERLLRFDA